MASKILYVKSSVFGDDGVSSGLSKDLIAQLKSKDAEAEVIERDLVSDPLPHFSLEYIGALSADVEARTDKQKALVSLGDGVINQVEEADIIVVTAPMYNFNIPSPLKAWTDYLARAGKTFRYTDSGPEGLLKDKKVYIVTTRGGFHKGEPSDTETPYLKNYFTFLGLSDIEFIYAEGLNMPQREEGLASAHKQIASL